MIRPKIAKLTKAQETAAYNMATERDLGRCVRCGYAGDVQRDHRQNRDNYNTRIEGLQLLCGPTGPNGGCHLWKTNNPDEANRTGYGVPRWANILDYPARRWISTDVGTHRRAWVLYAADVDLFEYPLGYREITREEAMGRMAGLFGEVA